MHARAHVDVTQEGGRPYILTGSKPRKSPGAPPACAPLPPPPTSRRQHAHSVERVLFAVDLTSIIATFWRLHSSLDGVRLSHPLGMCLHSIIITFTPASVALFDAFHVADSAAGRRASASVALAFLQCDGVRG